MRQLRLRTVLIGTGAALALVAGGTAAATAAFASSGTVYKGCVEGTSRVMEHVYTRANPPACPSGSFAATWNQVGQQGPPGPRGPAGPGLLAWAYVNANGTVASRSGNVTVANPGAGSYCIGVTGGTAHVAVASLDSLENTGGTVQAGVFAASGCPANASNILVVTRPQSQDGGFPGVNHAFYIIVS